MRRWAFALFVVGALFGIAAAAAWRDISAARVRLNDARARLEAVASNPNSLRGPSGRRSARAAVDGAERQLESARSLVIGSAPLRLTSVLPALARQRTGLLVLINDAKTGTAVSNQLLRRMDALADQTTVVDGAIPLDGLAAVTSALRSAAVDLGQLPRPATGLWQSLAKARRTLNRVAHESSATLLKGADAVEVSGSLLGGGGPRRYLIAVQNNAEMRDQGMVLSYAVVTFDNGRSTVEKSGPITDLPLASPVGVPLPQGTSQVFGSLLPLQNWQNVNATADWPLSARTMAAMYRATRGQDVDGVIGLDVPGLAALLRIIGSVPNPAGGAEITADNAAVILLHDYYLNLPRGENEQRKERLAEVAAEVITRLTTGEHDAVSLGRALGTAAAGGHFRVWSRNVEEERVFRRTGLGGGPAEVMADRTIHLSVQNASSSKLDYFQRQRVRVEVYVTEPGTAVVRTEVTLVNTAPKNAPPSYQFGPGGATQTKPGEYATRVYFWGPRGASQVRGIPESGLTLSQASTIVQPGEQESVIFHAVIPKAVRNGRLDLRLVPQPILVPADLEVRLHAPGWSVDGETTISRPWDRTITVGWGLKS